MGVKVFEIVRKKLGYSRYKMASELGIRQSAYDYLEQEARSCNSQTLVKLHKLAGEAGISADELFKLLDKKT